MDAAAALSGFGADAEVLMDEPLPLALSDEQLALVQQGAEGLPPEWHGRFLDAVANQLVMLDSITNMDVNHAIAAVLIRIMMAV